MNLKNFLKVLLALTVITIFVSTSAFAATWYVNNTNGNDITFDGTTAATPYQTISKAISVATAGDVINIAADTYTEATVAVTKNLTFVVYTFNGSSNANIVNGLNFSGTGTSNLGVTGGTFILGANTPASALVLTAGTVNIGTGNVSLVSGATITRTAGAFGAAPTFGANTNVVYNGAVDITSGPEIPASFGTGTLTGSLSAAKTVSISSATTVSSIVTNANTTFSFGQNVTLTGDLNNSGTIQLNSNTLTWAPAANLAVTKLGSVVSTTAGNVGNGTVLLTGTKTITTNGAAGEVPNLTIPNSYTGALILGANLTVAGTVTLSASTVGVFQLGNHVLSVWKDFSRTDNTLGNLDGLGTLSFIGTGAQAFTTGSSLSLTNVIVNKTSGTVTMGSSVNVTGNFTITAGSLELGDYNINMNGTGTFTNGGSFYSTSTNGYVAFNGASASITGAGTFGNILVNLSNAANTVATGSSINISGILFLNQGSLDIAAAGHTLTFNNTLVINPTIKINTTAANTAGITNTGGGSIVYAVNVNLSYTGADDYTRKTEWVAGVATKINDLTIGVASGKTVTGLNAASTINGVLTVNAGTTLNENAQTYTLAGTSKTHTVAGTVSNGTLAITGDGAVLNGSTVTADAATVNALTYNNTSGTFTSNNIKTISTNLSVTGGTANITLNGVTSVITGNVTLVSGTLNLNLPGTTTNTHGGDLVLTAGNLTYTRTSANNTIGGRVLLTAGTLTLGSNVLVDGTGANVLDQVDGNINLGGFVLSITPSAAVANDYNRTGAGTISNGTLVLDATTQDINVVPGATFTIPNVQILAGNVSFANSLTISNSLLLTAGNFTQTAGALTVSGNTITLKSGFGTIAGAVTLTGTAAAFTLEQDETIPTLTVATTGAVTVASNNTTARTITVNTAYTNTSGTLNLGINNLSVAGAFTYTAGQITEVGGGLLTWNVANPSLAAGFAIDNLTITGSNADVSTAAFTVNKYLTLSKSLTTSADGKLTLGDGATVERTLNAAVLSNLPTFGATTNLVYSGGAAITAAKEQPATVVNYTVNGAATNVTLVSNVSISGTLTLGGIITQAALTATMLNNSNLILKQAGTTAIAAKPLTVVNIMNITYDGTAGAFSTSVRELGPTTTAATHKAGNVTITGANTITLDADATFTGALTFNAAGNLDLAGHQLYLQGNISQTAAGFIVPASASTLNLNGGNTTLALKTGLTVSANLSIILNKATNTNYVTLSGGDLDFTAAPALQLAQGIFNTSATSSIILPQTAVSGAPVQGFTRTNGVIGGNVKKLIDIVTTAAGNTPSQRNSVVTFPVGDTLGNYRPIDLFFKTLPQSSVNLTVAFGNTNPGGANGFPIATSDNLHLSNYPAFFWYVKSDIPLAPSYQYDMDAQGQGYLGYLTDQIQNVRLVRRDSGNVNNPWIVQGGSSYDNSTIAANWPVVKVINATGGFSTQGSIFAYSQLNKAPSFTQALTSITKVGGDSVNVTYVATDPDLNATVTYSAVTLPSWAAFNASTGKLTGKLPNSAGTFSVTIRATDNAGASTDTTAVITVTFSNTAPTFVNKIPDISIKNDSTYTFVTTATDPDAGQTLKFALVSVTPAPTVAPTVDSVGTFKWKPSFTDLGKVFKVIVSVTDHIVVVNDTANITIISARKRGAVDSTSTGPDALSASDVLKYLVGLITLNPQQLYAADADLDGHVTALDAAWILYAAVNNKFPDGSLPKLAQMGSVSFGQLTSEENSNLITLPLILGKSQNVKAAYVELNIDSKFADVDNVVSTLPQGWLMVHNYANGVLRIAMSGVTPLTDGTLASISLKLKAKDAKFDVSGSAVINADLNSSLSSFTVKAIPNQFELSQNYPNPFNPSTIIKYQIAQDTRVSLTVYDMLGQKVKTLVNNIQQAGYYNVTWDGMNDFGRHVASGVYIYRLQSGTFTKTLKMNLLK